MKLNRHRIELASYKAEKIFRVMRWTWSVRGGVRVAAYVPDYIDIQATLIDLSKTIINKNKDVGGETVAACTGRLVARLYNRIDQEDEIRYYVSLQ